MSQQLRSAVVPAYVLACLVLGGSVQGIWGVAALQLIGIAIIGWSLLAGNRLALAPAARTLFAIAAAAIALAIVQLVPLPPVAWSAIPGREHVVEGFALLGQELPWLPVSLTPHDTAATLITLIPPLAVLAAMLVAGAYRASWIAIAVLVGTFASVLLGALQVGGGESTQSPWYLYRRTNHGFATGFFANSNHMATLLVVSVPLLFALIADLRKKSRNPRAAAAVGLVAAAGILVLLVGIFLNGSLAVLLLGLPVVAMSATILIPPRSPARRAVVGAAIVSVAAILAVYLTPLQDKVFASNSTSFDTRQEIWSRTVSAVGDHMATGSGVGSFPQVYPLYEDHSDVLRTFVNHAHNDYLEIALETGVPGILLVALFFLWWLGRAGAAWRSSAQDRYALAAAIASAAVLVHSLVDYPLRTAALGAIMAACLGLVAQPRFRPTGKNADLWPAPRHESL